MRRLREVQQATKRTGVGGTLIQTKYYMRIYVKGVLNTSNSAMNQHSQGLSKNTGNGPDGNWEYRGYGEDQGKKQVSPRKEKKRERHDNN